ncbi:MAG: YerC/YecD family TrpR-related protein [Clostridiales bacterium]|nr:YerC/YecD family TrpR-related protein [Clostridiales bacterium]
MKRSENMNALFEAVLRLESIDECYDFFEDLCTVSELKSMSQRLEVAKLLKSGAVYTDIAAKTGASTATISRVNRCINYGEGGYNLIIDRLRDKKNELL